MAERLADSICTINVSSNSDEIIVNPNSVLLKVLGNIQVKYQTFSFEILFVLNVNIIYSLIVSIVFLALKHYYLFLYFEIFIIRHVYV